jgi:vacuolar-type H+-ATPase subunit D/Vma8
MPYSYFTQEQINAIDKLFIPNLKNEIAEKNLRLF